ncbi:MAG: benzoate-CoA ligase family protein [Acidocella sp.]|nr:benzoate-CoA ligase family protein [Acidocella sp.]
MNNMVRTPISGNAADFFLDRHCREGRGDKTAFIGPERHLTYAGLLAGTQAFAAGLKQAGIKRESRIALLMLDDVDFPIAFWGAIRAGVIPIPINTLLPPDLVTYILADCRAELLVVSPSLLPDLDAALASLPDLTRIITADAELAAFMQPDTAPPVATHPDEVAFWLYSSGSTNMPKGVRHVHSSLRATVTTYAETVLKLRSDDVVYSAAKMFFAYGLGNAMTFPMAVGATTILLPHRPTPAAVLALMEAHNPSVFCGVPTLYAALLQHPGLGSGAGSARLRRCISAGEALPEAIGTAWRRTVGVDILDGIGSTEMLHIFLSNSDHALRYGTSGVAVPGYELRLVDGQGADTPDGEPGELLVKGQSAAEGYWNLRDKTRSTFVGAWTHTGDKYIRDADGFYRYCGRTDDMFKVSGIWVSPFEVEGALASHDAVLEAAVVGREDQDGLTKPRAFLVLKQGIMPSAALTDELKAFVKQKIGPWKYPRWIDIVDDLPKTATGKIQRYKLRQWN